MKMTKVKKEKNLEVNYGKQNSKMKLWKKRRNKEKSNSLISVLLAPNLIQIF